MALQAFLDESQDADVFVMAGYIAPAEAWLEFAPAWQEMLPLANLGPNGNRFKMSEMAIGQDWWRTSVFYRIIERYTGLAVSVHFRPEIIPRAMRRVAVRGRKINWVNWDNPYMLAFRAITDGLAFRRAEANGVLAPDAVIDFIFDDGRHEHTRIVEAWDSMKGQLRPEVAALYGSIRFEDDERFLPLQGADLWAWWVRRWEGEGGIERIKGCPFPFEFNPATPPKLVMAFDEDGLADYLAGIVRGGEKNLEVVILPSEA